MKLATVGIVFSPSLSPSDEITTVARYDATTGLWSIQGCLYSEHLKLLIMISDMSKAVDREKNGR